MMNEWIISSSILIGLVLLGRFLLRGRISLRLQYALWAVVLLRLLLPVQIFTSDFGTGSIAREVDISAPVRQVYVSANEERYEQAYDEAYRQVVAEYEAAQRDPVQMAPAVIETAAQERAQRNLELDLEQLLYHIWFAGMVVMASVIITCNVHLSIRLKRCRYALEVPDSLLPVYITEVVPTPCIFGVFKPAVYLTPDGAKDPQVRSHVLEHELTHYRHWDHVWSVLRSLCLVLHWYNPLVWIAAKVSRADAELACDEGALARLGENQRGDYGRTLIGLTCSAPVSDLLLTATTMTGSAGSIRERIRLLMKRPRNTVLTLTAVILLVTVIVGCTFSGAPETTAPTTPAETSGPTENENLHQTDLIYALPIDQAMEDLSDKNPRKLTPEEITRAREAFGGTVYDEAKNEYVVTPVVAFFTSYYDDVTELDFAEFLRYFPVTAEATEEEFQLLRQKYGEKTNWAEHETLQDMPVPVHRYQASDIDALTRRYANIPYQEFQYKESVYYLEETDSYYNFISDFGLGSFPCVDGFVYDGGAVLYSENAVLFLSETLGNYTIRAHLPVVDGNVDNDMSYTGKDLPIADDPGETNQATQVRALFDEGGDPWYLAALAAPYADYNSFDAVTFFSAGQTAVALTDAEKAVITEVYGKNALKDTVFRMTEQEMDEVLERYAGTMVWNVDLSEFVFCRETGAYLLVKEEVPELRHPEILYCDQPAQNQVRMIYRFPGEEQRYCATLLKGENWKVYSNHLLLDKPLNARALTEEETAAVRLAFSSNYYDAAADERFTNPRAAFLLDMYSDISEMSRSKFLTYYPATEVCEDEEEFQLLKKKYPEAFENEQTIRDMNWPIHRIPASELKAVMAEYTLANWDDLPYGGWYHYLEETDCYYTYYSDVGLFGFPCTGGWVYDGGAMLYNNFSTPMSVLILTEQNGKYYIQAHLPAIVAE